MPIKTSQGESRVAKNIRWLALANIGVKPFWFLFLLLSARFLGPSEFGSYMYAFSFVSIIAAFFDGGVDLLVVRELSLRTDHFSDFFARSSMSRVLLSGLAGVFAIFLGLVCRLPIGGIGLLSAVVSYSVLNALMIHARFVFRAYETLEFEALSIVLEKGCVIVFCAVALIHSRTAEGFAVAYAGAYAVACSFTFSMIVRRIGVPRWEFSMLKSIGASILKPALPFALLNIFTVIYFRSGSVMLGWLTGSESIVGHFNAGFRLVESYMLFPGIVTAPMFARFARADDHPSSVAMLVHTSFRGIVGVSLCMAVPLFLMRTELTVVMFGESYAEAAPIIGLMALTMIPVGLNYLFGTLVAAIGLQNRANVVVVIVTIGNILTNFWAIRAFGLVGAGCVTLATELSLAIGYGFLASRRVPLNGLRGPAIQAVMLSIGLYGVSFFLPSFWNPILRASILALFSLVGAFMLRLLSVSDFERILGPSTITWFQRTLFRK